MSFSITSEVDESLDIFWNSINGVSSTKSLIFNLATTGKLVAQMNNEKHPKDLLDSVNKGEMAHESVSGWLNLKLNFCTEIFNGNSTNSSEKAIMARNQDGLNYIATKDVGYGFQPIEYNTGLRIGSKNNNFKIAPKNSVLICLEGGSAGKKMGLVEKEIAFGNKLFAVVCNNWIEPNYLLVYFLSSKFQSDFQAQMSGIIGGISKAKFSNLIIPLPPLEEQKRILDKVKQLITLCDGLETHLALRDSLGISSRKSAVNAISTVQSQEEFDSAWNRIQKNWDVIAGTPESIESLRSLILELAVAGKLVKQKVDEGAGKDLLIDIFSKRGFSVGPENEPTIEIPRNWARAKLGELLYLEMGQSPNSDSYNHHEAGLPFYQGKTDFGSFVPTPRVWCSSPTKIAEPGDVLLSVRAPVGPTNYLEVQSCIGRGLAALRPLGGMKTEFVLWWLRAHESQIADMGTGTTFIAVSKKNLEPFIVSVPPLAEQSRIVDRISELMDLCDKLESAQKIRSQLAEKFARSIVSASG